MAAVASLCAALDKTAAFLRKDKHYFKTTSLAYAVLFSRDMAFLDVPVCAICSSRECAVALYILTMDLCFKTRINLCNYVLLPSEEVTGNMSETLYRRDVCI